MRPLSSVEASRFFVACLPPSRAHWGSRAYSPVLDVAGHLQKNAPINGVLVSEATYSALVDGRAGLEPGNELPRESVKTWVLAPEKIE